MRSDFSLNTHAFKIVPINSKPSMFIISQDEQHGGRGGGGEGCAARLSLLVSFTLSVAHEQDWPPYKVVFRVGNQYAECEKQHTWYYRGTRLNAMKRFCLCSL